MVLFLECKVEVMRWRLKKRAETSQRKDENISEIRIKTFVERTLPSLDYFSQTGNLVIINCERDIKEVNNEIVNKYLDCFS